jgi:CBS domain containing-hemolysin-like protein
MSDILLKILALMGLVAANGFFVAAEFAIVKIRGTRLQELAAEGNLRARWAAHVVGRLDAYLSATQLGITLASLGLGWLGEPFLARILEAPLRGLGINSPQALHSTSFVVGFSILTFLHIVLGELAPKSLAIRRAEATSLAVVAPLIAFYIVFFPVIWVFNSAANLFLKALGLPPAREFEMAHSPEELGMILAESHKSGLLTEDEQRIIRGALTFRNRAAREIMVPRTRIIALSTQRTLEENLHTAREEMHTRFPLCDGDLDRVVGVIHIKDLLWALRERDPSSPTSEVLMSLRRPIHILPALVRLDRLLQTFQQSRVQMAVLVSEYGGTEGLVTLEDLLEEIVGEIQDEFDEEAPLLVRQPDGSWLVDAAAPLARAAETLGLVEPETEATTIGGYILELMGRIPVRGDQVRADRYLVTVEGASPRRISLLRFEEAQPADEEDRRPPAPIRPRAGQ